jgi:hypothetical protein
MTSAPAEFPLHLQILTAGSPITRMIAVPGSILDPKGITSTARKLYTLTRNVCSHGQLNGPRCALHRCWLLGTTPPRLHRETLRCRLDLRVCCPRAHPSSHACGLGADPFFCLPLVSSWPQPQSYKIVIMQLDPAPCACHFAQHRYERHARTVAPLVACRLPLTPAHKNRLMKALTVARLTLWSCLLL